MTFELYVEEMTSHISNLAKEQENSHPFLGRDDLRQEGLIALWQVWSTYAGRPFNELRKIGIQAAWFRMVDEYRRAFGRSGIASPFYQLREDEDIPMSGEAELWFIKEDFKRVLSSVGKRVFEEMINPSDKTVNAFTKSGNLREVYAYSLGIPVKAVRLSIYEIRKKTIEYLNLRR